jgi:peptide chain release factor 1
MNTPTWPKLEEALAKYHSLEQQLADPAVAADGVRYGRLAKELATLAKQAKPYLELKKLGEEITRAETDLAKEADAEMRQMLEEELGSLRARHEALRAKIEDMLLVDPSEDFDSVIM